MKKDRLLKNPFLVRLLGLLMAFFFLSAFTAPEKPDYGIYDPNHYLTEEVVTQIRDLNEANSQKAEKLQIGVYIVDSLEGESIETVANETARTWKIGYSGDNFGSLIVVAVQDRKSRIETSNNTAIRITDYQTKQILAASRTDFKTGDYGKGILAIAKDWTISFIEEVEHFHLMIPLKSNVILIASVGKNRVAIVAHLVIVRTVNLWTMCSESG